MDPIIAIWPFAQAVRMTDTAPSIAACAGGHFKIQKNNNMQMLALLFVGHFLANHFFWAILRMKHE